jgi:hypothetical protein
MATNTQTLARRRWSIVAIFPGEATWSTRVFEAAYAAPTSNGALHVYNRASQHTASRRTVLMLAPDQWRSCEPEGAP